MNINITNKDTKLEISINRDDPEEIRYFSLLPDKLIYSEETGEEKIIKLSKIERLIIYWKKDNNYYLKNRKKVLASMAYKKQQDIIDRLNEMRRLQKV